MLTKMRWGFFIFIFTVFSFIWADYQLRLKDIINPRQTQSTFQQTQAPKANPEAKDPIPNSQPLNSESAGSLAEVQAELENPKDLKSLAKKLNAEQIEYLTKQLTSDFSSMERKALSLELLSNNDSDLSHKGLRQFLDHARFKHDEASTMLKLQAQDALSNSSGTIK